MDAILSTPHAQDPHPVTARELHEAIFTPEPWKSPGPDGIPYACLRHCEDILAPYLLPLFTASLRLAHIPAAWKRTRVVAVPKPDKDHTSPKGYRPISLNSCISKVLERIVLERLTYFLEKGLLLPRSQYGFRKGRSTELALWRFVTAATKALQARHATVLLSLDIQSAYDRVWHKGLIRKLATLGVPPTMLAWLLAFLSSRQARVHIGGAVCARLLALGVPQGSPLSPILFLVFVGDLLSRLQQVVGTGTAGFADDLNVWWRISRLHPGDATSIGVSSVVESWGTEWQQTFNPDKCKVLVISHSIAPTPVVSLSGVQLECQPYLRCL